MQNFLNENYIGIIALVVSLGLIFIYLILRKQINKPYDDSNEYKLEDEKSLFEETEAIKEEQENVVQEEIEEEKIDVRPTVSRKKRELIKHEKITKDDFSIFNGVKILIAEDNIINQKVITGLLSTSGIHITIANDGQETLNILENNSDFSMIFMDAHMPILDGFQATRLIRKNPKYNDIPVIALSGDTAVDDIRNMLNVGMEAHIEKPLKMDALYDVLYIYTTGNEPKNSPIENNNEGLKEFDTVAGLEICGGDKEFYLEILNDFTLKYSNSAQLIQELINKSEGLNANKILLDISGVAANIGADELHKISIDLKNSISNPADLEYINHLRKYKRSLQQICEAINEYTSQN